MSFRERSLAWRMAALILGGAGLVLFAVMASVISRNAVSSWKSSRPAAMRSRSRPSTAWMRQPRRTEAAVQARSRFELLPAAGLRWWR